MSSRRGPSLAERSGQRTTLPDRTAGRHCWVQDAPGHPGRFPGLLVEWRSSPDGWWGRVMYAIDDAGDAARLVERWLPAECLIGVDGDFKGRNA